MSQTSPQPWSGILPVNKPSGPTTYDLIRWIKRSIPKTKLGHTGTLDPMASGLVILLLGKATKIQSHFMGQDKTYRGTIRLGVQTDTGDIQGKEIAKKEIPKITEEIINGVFAGFLGNQEQTPPIYSAIKHKGRPLYKYARKGQDVKRGPRPIKIHSLSFLKFNDKNEIEFRTHVSSGTYVRVLAEDISEKLGTKGTLSSLCRESIGDLKLEEAIEGELLKSTTPDKLFERLRSQEVYA